MTVRFYIKAEEKITFNEEVENERMYAAYVACDSIMTCLELDRNLYTLIKNIGEKRLCFK